MFLTPYLKDAEQRSSNISLVGVDFNLDEIQHESSPNINNLDGTLNESNDTQDSLSNSRLASSRIVGKKSMFTASEGQDDNTLNESIDVQDSTSSITSSQHVRKKSRSIASQGPSAATVLQEYLSRKETALNRNQSDPMIEFFTNMAKTVKTFPIQDQVHIKVQLFQMVNSVEMRLALTSPT